MHRPGPDTTLSAFAQLATLRLNTSRALISLIDRSNQYILAEATQKSALLSDASSNNEDKLWFGYTTLPRSLGICGKAQERLLSQRKDVIRRKVRRPLPLIINDLTEEGEFRDQPFLASHPSLRFYAMMPITTKSGLHVGTLSVMDERPRAGLDDIGIKFLGDMAVTIMAHLERTRSEGAHRRSGNMIKGLGLFLEGRVALQDWWIELGNNKSRKKNGPRDGAEAETNEKTHRHDAPTTTVEAEVAIPLDGQSWVSHSVSSMAVPPKAEAERVVALPPGSTAPGAGDVTSAAYTPASEGTTSDQSPMLNPSAALEVLHSKPPTPTGEQHQQRLVRPKRGSRSFGSDEEGKPIPESLRDIFMRASNILSQSIEVDGAVFLDAGSDAVDRRKGEPSQDIWGH